MEVVYNGLPRSDEANIMVEEGLHTYKDGGADCHRSASFKQICSYGTRTTVTGVYIQVSTSDIS